MTSGYERAYDGVIAGAGVTSAPTYSGGAGTLVAELEPGI